MLLGRRSKEPYKGEYDVLGGFLHEGEHPAEGALREAKEESGLDMRIITQLGIYMDTYGPEAEEHTLNVYHVAEITGGEMKPGDDVDLLEWWDIENPPALAFENNRAALRDLQLWYRQHAH